MTYQISQRPSVALTAIQSYLGGAATLAAQIVLVNNDLRDRVQPYRVPDVDADQIKIRLQDAEIPSGLQYPEIRLVAGPQEASLDASSRGGLNVLGLTVAIYLDTKSIADAGAADPVEPISDEVTEEELVLALLDLATAVQLALRDPTAGVFSSTSGVVQIRADLARAPQIHYVPAPGYRSSAAWIALEFRLTLEQTY